LARLREAAADRGERLLALVAARTFPLYAALTALYVLFRAGSFSNIPTRLTDTASYEQVASLPLWRWRFYTGQRGFTLPLLYKLFAGGEARTVAQLVISILAWLVLAGTVARCVRHSVVRPVAFAAVLIFSLTTEVILWDTLELSESLTFSLTALLVAAWLAVVRRPTWTRVVLVLVVALLWSFARDTNAYILLLVGVIAALTLLDRSWRTRKAALAVGCVAIGLATVGSANAGHRWVQPLRDVVVHRVLTHPALRSYFVAHGLDARTNWTDGPWFHHRARGVYVGYLLRHPGYLLAAPLSGRQEALYSTPDNADSLLDPSTKSYDNDASHRFLPLPRVLERVAFPRGVALLCLLVALVVAAAAVLAWRGLAEAVWLVPGVILLSTYPHLLVVWHLSGVEVDRHALEAALLLRLALLLLVLLCLDVLVSPRRGSARPLGGLPGRRHAAAQVVPERDDRRPRDENVVAGEADAEGRGSDEPDLPGQGARVEPALPDERDRACEQGEMEEPASVAEHPVRDDFHPVDRRQAAQHRAAQRDQPAVLEHAHLAPVLGLVRRRRLLERERLRLVDGSPATLHHQVREREVVAEARVDVHVVLASQRVDRAVPARHGVQARLRLPEPELVPPVGAFAVRAVRALEPQPAADVGDLGIGEVADEPAQRVGRPGAVRVREGDDLAPGLRHGVVLRRHLPAARRTHEPHPALPVGADEVVGAVGRRVGDHDELELLTRVVELEQVLDAARDHALLVVRGHDHRDARLGRLVA
jgi:hypothetical protein